MTRYRLAALLAVEINGGRAHPRSFTDGVTLLEVCRTAGLTTRRHRRCALVEVVDACYAANASYRPEPHIMRALGWTPAHQILASRPRVAA